MAHLVLLSTPFLDTRGGVEADWEIKILKRLPADPHHSSFIHQSETSSHPKTESLSDFMSGPSVKHDYERLHLARI